jgi:ArsR family transcriptional regulator
MEPIKIFKALADESRLQIIKTLYEKARYVEELAERLNLSSSTISFHLKKLEEAGLLYSVKEQYYVNYHLRRELLEKQLKEMIKATDKGTNEEEKRMENYRKKVIDSFFEYGKLKSLPVQRKKKKIILEEIARAFEAEKIYSEKEVNLLIADYHDDFCTIRRDMISEKLLKRENNLYQLESLSNTAV